MIGIIILILICGVPTAIIANNKRFEPERWIFTLGPIGLLVVIALSNPREKEISGEEMYHRIDKGNKLGKWLCITNIILAAVPIILFLVFFDTIS